MIHGLSRPKNQIRWLLLEGISPTAHAILEKTVTRMWKSCPARWKRTP